MSRFIYCQVVHVRFRPPYTRMNMALDFLLTVTEGGVTKTTEVVLNSNTGVDEAKEEYKEGERERGDAKDEVAGKTDGKEDRALRAAGGIGADGGGRGGETKETTGYQLQSQQQSHPSLPPISSNNSLSSSSSMSCSSLSGRDAAILEAAGGGNAFGRSAEDEGTKPPPRARKMKMKMKVRRDLR